MREGIMGGQYRRLTVEELVEIHEASIKILWDPGISVENIEAKTILAANGATVAENGRVRIPAKMVWEALKKAPKAIKMGARKEENIMILDGAIPRVYAVTGGCATKLLKFEEANGQFQLVEKQTKLNLAKNSPGGFAPYGEFVKIIRLIEHLKNIDGLSRPIEPDVSKEWQDLVKAFLFLNNTAKHCCLAELVDVDSLPKVIKLVELVAGGKEALSENPLISFITCLTVSPLRLVNDTTDKFMKIVREGIPVMISSDPQALSTSLVGEKGQLIQNNAEILSALVLGQLVKPGAPMLYGAIPITSSLENLSPQWSSPETIARLAAKSQIARFYGIPCYGTAAIADVLKTDPKYPNLAHLAIQKTHSYLMEIMGGAQYIHNAFGLMNLGNEFALCPELYVVDDELLARVKFSLKRRNERVDESIKQIQEAIADSDGLVVFMESGGGEGRKWIYRSAHFQNAEISWERALEVKNELLSRPVENLSPEILQKIFEEFPQLKEVEKLFRTT